jgi:hypothetical protein
MSWPSGLASWGCSQIEFNGPAEVVENASNPAVLGGLSAHSSLCGGPMKAAFPSLPWGSLDLDTTEVDLLPGGGASLKVEYDFVWYGRWAEKMVCHVGPYTPTNATWNGSGSIHFSGFASGTGQCDQPINLDLTIYLSEEGEPLLITSQK